VRVRSPPPALFPNKFSKRAARVRRAVRAYRLDCRRRVQLRSRRDLDMRNLLELEIRCISAAEKMRRKDDMTNAVKDPQL
jgi:hypothetical protein